MPHPYSIFLLFLPSAFYLLPSQMNLLNPDSSTPSTSWRGKLELEFACRQDSTQLMRGHVQAPLKVQRPFYPEGPEVCHVVALHTAGGIVGGDRLSLNIHLHPNAQALITTAAAGKVYRSTGAESHQTIQIQVESGACLEWLPQETILFDGANYRQAMRVDLAEDAVWMGWEITRLGRTARQEQFLHGNWRSHTQIFQNGRPLWVDPLWIQGGSAMLTSLHGLAGCPVVGSFAVVGQVLPAEIVEKARSLWQDDDASDRATLMSQCDVGITRLMSGILCRYRGHSTGEARRWFTSVWELVRPVLLHRVGCKPRVWQHFT
jgi:urease accessory protein